MTSVYVEPIEQELSNDRTGGTQRVPTDPRTLDKGNRTNFRPEEAPETSGPGESKRRRLMRQYKHHRDVYPGYRNEIDMTSNADRDRKVDVMTALGAQLSMSKRIVYKATRKLFTIDVSSTGHALPAVGFCVYVVVFDEETSDYEACTESLYWESDPGEDRIYWPFRTASENDAEFQRVADDLRDAYTDVSQGVFQSIIQQLESGTLPTRDSNRPPSFRQVSS